MGNWVVIHSQGVFVRIRRAGLFAIVVFIATCSGQSRSAIEQSPTSATSKQPRKLYKNTRLLLSAAAARGQKDADLVVASKPGRNAAVASLTTRLGGDIRYRADEVDYLRVKLPLAQVEAFAESGDIQAIEYDVNYYWYNPGIFDSYKPPPPPPPSNPPEPDTPLSHPYLATRDLDVDRFRAENPKFDGRGAGLAMLDANPDLLLPELQSATSLDGKPIDKITDVLSGTDPRDDNDPLWVKMDTQVQAEGGHFTHKDAVYTAPADGSYRLGFFDERQMKEPSYLKQDVNFDGNPEGSSGLFAVLWDQKNNTVWVDTEQDHDFTHDKPLMDFARRRDFGIFGKPTGPGVPRKSLAFTVQTDLANNAVRLNLCIWQHVSMVSGAAVGKGFYSGSFNGVAPEATLVSVYNGNTIPRIIESGLLAARSDKVDVICLEPGLVEETVNPLYDGRAVVAVIFDRIIDKYQKPVLSPAHNPRGVTTVIDNVAGRKLISIGGYQSSESYRINDGAIVKNYDNLHLVGGYGPSGDGRLKPDVISPSEIVSTDVGYRPAEKKKGIYDLPFGHSVAGGTSTAGPTASAAVILLISAAKQTGVRHDAARVRTAVLSSARFLPGVPAYQQGNGLIQVDAAWELLKAMDKKYDPLVIESRAPVRTAISEYLETPHEGNGIFEREGWSPGQTGTRTVTFTRTSGTREAIPFQLEWVGNDGTFESASSITLPLNQPVALPISISAKDAGVHSAILNLRRAGYPGIAYQVMNTVIAAEDFKAEAQYTVERKVEAERPGDYSFFLRVPPNTPALSIDLTIPPGVKPTVTGWLLSPDRNANIHYGLLGATEKGRLSQVVEHPSPGVWELLLFNNNFAFHPEEIDSKPLAPVPVTLRASLVGIQASPAVWKVDASGSASGMTQKIGFKNTLAPIRAAVVETSLGSARRKSGTIQAGERQIFELDVPDGAKALIAKIESTSDPQADLDLYLYKEEKGIFVPKGIANGAAGLNSITLENPDGGKWRVIVDAFKVPQGSTEFTYEDVILHSIYGRITTKDVATVRSAGAEWDATATVTIGAMPTGDRKLVGYVAVAPIPDKGEPAISRAGATKPSAEGSILLGEAEVVFH